MPEQDSRRVRVAAPADGEASTPPARRRPQVVAPSDTPAARRAEPLQAEGETSFFTPPVQSATNDLPQGAAAGQRVVVPAPGADAPSTPPPDVRPRAASPGSTRLPNDEEVATVLDSNRDPDAVRDRPEGWRRFVPSKRAVGISALVVLLLIGGGIGWSYTKFRSIERVDLTEVLASGNGTNYLIVGTDSREGIDPDAPDAGAFLGEGADNQGPLRSDTIMILRIDSDGTHTLSVPRDLYVTIAETEGQRSRINAAFNGGPTRLIKTLDQELGLPIHHYLEINFVSFAGLVDAVGGITIDFPHPAFDTRSGLDVAEAGPQKLDGSQAVAYVRSRYYTEIIDGRNQSDPTGDLGRVLRQQQFLAALGSEIRNVRNPFTLAKVADAMAAGVKIDSDMGFFTAINLFLKLRGIDPEINALPVTNFRAGAAAVLALVQPGADEILARFGSDGARPGV